MKPAPKVILPAAVQTELDAILASKPFQNSGRISRFLRFVVEETLAGRGGDLKEYLVGVEVFNKGQTFDVRTDSIVRVEAMRLRSKLREYYHGEGRNRPLIIELPKGGYVPVFRPRLQPYPLVRIGARAGAGILVLAVVIAAGIALSGSRRPDPVRLAVLPFDNLSPDPGSEYFCQGFLDELTTAVAKRPGLRVLSRNSASRFKRGDRISEIGKALKVSAVLEGSIRIADDRVRVTAQLIDAVDETHVWTETYDRPVAEVSALQQIIAASVGNALKAPSTGDTSPGAIADGNPKARDLYWRGRYARRQATPDNIRESIQYYRQAVELDPAFAPAHAALGEAYATMGFHGMTEPAGEAIANAKSAARQAIGLDPALAEPHALLAWIAFFYDRDWPSAERDFRRAVELNPSYAKAHTWFALGLLSRGRFREAVVESRTAQELDPIAYLTNTDMGVVLYCARRYDEAVRWANQSLASDPNFSAARIILGSCLAAQGRTAEAIREYERALQGSERYSYVVGRLGQSYAAGGRMGEARQLAKELTARAPSGEAHYIHLALIHAGLGEKENALECLETAAQRREADVNFLKVEPAFDSLRSDPRFAALLHKVGLD